MSKATLTFTLPEEAHEYRTAIRGSIYLSALYEFANDLREKTKYSPSKPKDWYEISDMFWDVLKSYKIDPYEE